MTYMEKIESTEIKWDDLKPEYMYSCTTDPDWLNNSDPEEAFREFLNDYDIPENAKQPKIYVYFPDKPLKVGWDDIADMYYDHVGLDVDDFPAAEMEEALKPVNTILESLPRSYDCIGYICPNDIKDVWQTVFKEFNNA